MINIYDDETLAAALGLITDATLAALIDRIAHDARASDLWEMTCIIVVDFAESADELESFLGFDPLIGPLGAGEAGEFLPWWNWLEHHQGWFELLQMAGSDFAYFLLVPDEGADRTGLAALCREHAFD